MVSATHLPKWRILGWLIGLAAALFSLGTIVQSKSELLAVFTLADPTGLFGARLVLFGLLANLSVILLFLAYVRRGWDTTIPLWYGIVFALKLVEAAALLPCLIGKPEALCGVLSVLISELTSPVIILMVGILIYRSSDATLRRTGLAASVLLLCVAIASWRVLTPRNPEGCSNIAEVSGRGACLEKFALKQTDLGICRAIELRSTRLECMRKVAERARRPEICDEIRDPPGAVLAAYETPDVQTRSLCYYVLAFDLRRRDLCLKIETGDLRQRCLSAIPGNGP